MANLSPLLSATLTLLSVHPASPVLLTKNGPLGAQYILLYGIIFKYVVHLTHLKFENRLRAFRSQFL